MKNYSLIVPVDILSEFWTRMAGIEYYEALCTEITDYSKNITIYILANEEDISFIRLALPTITVSRIQ